RGSLSGRSLQRSNPSERGLPRSRSLERSLPWGSSSRNAYDLQKSQKELSRQSLLLSSNMDPSARLMKWPRESAVVRQPTPEGEGPPRLEECTAGRRTRPLEGQGLPWLTK